MANKKNIAILCGGSTYEHEVSIISGIQIAENIDRSKYAPFFVYFDVDNNAFLLHPFKKKVDFKNAKRTPVTLAKGTDGLVLKTTSWLTADIPVDLCFLAFHGGDGEAGQIQGLLELYKTPYTGASQEAAVIAMNKTLTKEVLSHHTVPVLPWMSFLSSQYTQKSKELREAAIKKLSFPIIIKPVHLGSSIGITIVHTPIELEQQLAVATRLDTEVLLEPALQEFTEYNVSVRSTAEGLELSSIEEPKREDKILSFDDKYANGSKKGGGKGAGGMELLDRTVPADISDELAEEIRNAAIKAYNACRLAGMLRIDFMYSQGTLYCTEINPIPGSHSFYLWEPAGYTFQEQITQGIEDALRRHAASIQIEPYETDIVDKFLA